MRVDAARRFALEVGLAVLVLSLSACGTSREIGADLDPPNRVSVPTSSVHYRDYRSADDLARATRWRPGAPVWIAAHRGGPVPGLPENAIETFENVLNHAPALIETDVRQTADGVLVLLHDDTLDRTTTGTGPLGDATLEDVRRLRLVADDTTVTTFRVPTLAEALAWAEARAVLLLDVKSDVDLEALVAEVRRANAEDQVAVITYSLERQRELFALAPDLVVSASASRPEDVDALLSSGLDLDRMIAWTGIGVPDAGVVDRLHAAGIRAQAGAYGEIDGAARAASSPQPYDIILETGADVLSSDVVPLAALAARNANLTRRASE
ncbi:glycerophosphodiester phosphodiesterase family protein [Rubrivirga sp.]|uniref:glycerophosphodiester phosphodiesterase family protein n=1 Tax=Rubrivirga sp. TaxID=1885344 RepID=UPI003C75B66D